MASNIEILHIDDNDLDIMLTQEVFQDSDLSYNLHSANDGEEGLAYLKKEEAKRPNLILLDLNMPVMDGKEFLEIVKSDSQLKSIPVVILTTSASEADISFCYENYANAYITKTIDYVSFQESIKKLESFWFEANKLPF